MSDRTWLAAGAALAIASAGWTFAMERRVSSVENQVQATKDVADDLRNDIHDIRSDIRSIREILSRGK